MFALFKDIRTLVHGQVGLKIQSWTNFFPCFGAKIFSSVLERKENFTEEKTKMNFPMSYNNVAMCKEGAFLRNNLSIINSLPSKAFFVCLNLSNQTSFVVKITGKTDFIKFHVYK